jgi:hypothetical protein
MTLEQEVCNRGTVENGVLICPNKNLKRRGIETCDYALIGEICPRYQLKKEEQDKTRKYRCPTNLSRKYRYSTNSQNNL